MIEILILSAIITARLHARDRMYHKQGLPPPSSKLIEAWLDRRKKAGKAPAGAKPAKYGMWRYAWQRWLAMWELQSIQAEQRHQQKVADRKAGKAPEPKPPLKGRVAASWQWVVDNIIAPRGEPGTDAAKADSALGGDPLERTETPDGPRIACEHCGQTLRDTGGHWTHPSSAGCPAAPGEDGDLRACPACGTRYQAPGPEKCTRCSAPLPALDTHRPGRPDKSVGERLHEADNRNPDAYPYGHGATTSEGVPMTQPATQQSGEVTGLMSAIAYAEAVAAAHEAHSTGGGEHYRASLSAAEVGEQTIQTAAAAQEASEIAGGAWRAHAAKLREQLAAKEAVTSETGSKEFLLSE